METLLRLGVFACSTRAPPSGEDPTDFHQWHSTAVSKNHGSMGVPCDVAIAGLVPAANGEWVLDQPRALALAGVCGANLAESTTCTARRIALRPRPGALPTTESEKWLRGVQDTREGALAFMREEHFAYSKDLWKTERCNPATFGPVIELPRHLGGTATVQFSGAGLCGGTADESASFSVWLQVTVGAGPLPTAPLAIRARLVGPTIVAATHTFAHQSRCRAGSCVHTLRADFQYTVPSQDAGAYLLEVFVAKVLTHPLKQLVFRGGATIRLASTSTLHVRRTPHARSPPQLCSTATRPGRWVRMHEGAQGGRAAYVVNDALRFNRGYWWQPYDCSYRAYAPMEIRQCLHAAGVSRLGFSGDSLGREPFANFAQLLMGGNASLLDGRRFKGKDSGAVDVGRDVSLLWNPPIQSVDAFLISTGVVMMLFNLRNSANQVAEAIKAINQQTSVYARDCAQHGVLCIFQANPAIAHGDNAAELDLVVRATRAHAESLGLPILDSYEPALSRWFATHDGVHYTFSARVVEYPDPPFRWQWQGGVSHMNTMVYVNLLCNGGLRRRQAAGGSQRGHQASKSRSERPVHHQAPSRLTALHQAPWSFMRQAPGG